MEFDSRSLDLNGTDLCYTEYGDTFLGDIHCPEEEQPSFLEAKTIYVFMPRDIPVSRASRLQWLLDHLNTIITVPSFQKVNESSNELEVISAVPRENSIVKCNRFLITCRTEILFLARVYRFVYCLDMSPSHATVDITKGEVLFDEVLSCFKACMEGLLKQCTIPGSSFTFQPCIYVTVMVNTPFFITPAQQVLVKGIQISSSNLQEVLKFVQNQFYLIEGKIADVATTAHDQIDTQKAQSEAIVGSLFDLAETGTISHKMSMVSPDVNFVNMLRYSMLAISLLPENSLSHILVITDGVVAMPDSNIMESLLVQLHYDSISVSFLKIGSAFYPHTSAGYVSYGDLLYFFAQSTMGTSLENFPVIAQDSSSLNIYHELFLLWSFHGISNRIQDITSNYSDYKTPILLMKRHTEENISASVLLLLARRMREGFTVDNVMFFNGIIDVRLCLQWKPYIYIYYKVSSQWPIIKNTTHYEVYISAPYEFLHDITCLLKKDQKSLYRQAVIDRFWLRLLQLSTGESNLLQQIGSFPNSSWYHLPESVKSRIPVFILNNTSSLDIIKLSISSADPSFQKFGNIWQPICQMETNSWRKWLHTHKISIVLKHDQQLPKYLHLANSSQRYQIVQCRQAATILYESLANWSSSVLVDNHTYLKFLYKEHDKPPNWFCIIRISSKLPCAVLNLGFLTNTPAQIRHEVCRDLRAKLSSLTYKPSPLDTKEHFCCLLLQKPLEKILIRYERVPTDFNTVVFPDGTQPPNGSATLPSPITGNLFTTLSRYLYHKRWIWSAMLPHNPRLSDTAISRILNTLTRMRIKEDFNFVHSSSGIITMVLELWMDTEASCVVQYVLFPPHCTSWNDECSSCSEDEFDPEIDCDAEFKMVTEVWIEPQYGKVVSTNPRISYLDNKRYYEIADVISNVDSKCINSLLTMEHLSLMCQENSYMDSNIFSRMNSLNSTGKNVMCNSRNSFTSNNVINDNGSIWYPMITPRIEHIPFNFDPISILPLCEQTELLFSMFLEGKETSLHFDSSFIEKPNHLLLENLLEHLEHLHDQELDLTKEDSDKFTQHILLRHKNKPPTCCPISDNTNNKKYGGELLELPQSQWRCFLKGISTTHIILTFIPSTLQDLKELVNTNQTNTANVTESLDIGDCSSSKESNCSEVPINTSTSLTLPIYVFDCPLAMLVNAYINHREDSPNYSSDSYEDHRFKHTEFVHEDCIRLKGGDIQKSNVDIHNNEAVIEEKYTERSHCRALILTHTKCFTISLFIALHHGLYIHSTDVQSAMDQCEETIIEIDITDYIMTVCGHLKNHDGDIIDVQDLHQATPCSELKALHMLIKEKFFKMVNIAFCPIPTNTEFYFCRYDPYNIRDKSTDSDDEISNEQSEVNTNRIEKDLSLFSEGPHLLHRMSSRISDMVVTDIYPLFLHFICTLRFNNVDISNKTIRVVPTCIDELIQSMEPAMAYIDKQKLQITLDMFCLTLPVSVQNIISTYSEQAVRSTSFCSDGFQPSITSTISQNSFNSEHNPGLTNQEPFSNFPEYQQKAIIYLKDEIKWLLKDEIATSLLDQYPVTVNSLNFVTKHVAESTERSSCILDMINLYFVFGSPKSHEKFTQEFSEIHVPGYTICKEDSLYYLEKSNYIVDKFEGHSYLSKDKDASSNDEVPEATLPISCNAEIEENYLKPPDTQTLSEVISQQSDISSGSQPGTDGGYDEDISDDDDDYEWLININQKRQHLPNFWLIMKIDEEAVAIYFHCRFLELPTAHAEVYMEVQRVVRDAIRDICKRVNQSLLLQSLYETRTCDSLLETEDVPKDWGCDSVSNISRNASYSRLKSMNETMEDSELMTYSTSLSETSLNFKPGYFSCPVVWETHFILHPRLKTGPGKPGISRGILALKNILDKFSVSNRNNMFVYQDKNSNVFYLRLHENIIGSGYRKSSSMKSNDYENFLVSRSPSVASLPSGHNRSIHSDHSVSSTTLSDIRPRVRSFGEKECNDDPSDDTLILKVHGITKAGTDVQCDLIQVLQNRLDDAVLEFLSIMLARNSMCPLTPEDVHFIQKPFRLPEVILKIPVHECALQNLDAFTHYLRQNLLQFLNIPKYTDARPHYHFKDYTSTEQRTVPVASEENILIFNQSQNPSSGSRGIACIAFALIIDGEINGLSDLEEKFKQAYQDKSYTDLVTTNVWSEADSPPNAYLEFRLWNQGRVNIDTLTHKLKASVSHAIWDIVTEYYLLNEGLCEQFEKENLPCVKPVLVFNIDVDISKETEFNCDLGYIKCITKPRVTYDDGRKMDMLLLPRKKNRRVIPPNSKTTRSITFDDVEKENNVRVSQNNGKSLSKFSVREIGSEGVLCKTYSKYLPEWFDFGVSISVPSVKKQCISLNAFHILNNMIKELMGLIQDSPKAFQAVRTNALKNISDQQFLSFAVSQYVQSCIIVSRNFEHWKASTAFNGTLDFPDILNPQSLKHIQKFTPTVLGDTFIPRQKFLWILVESDNITIHTYNWTKDNVEKLIHNCTNLGLWLSVRSYFLNSVIAQRLGLFYNQPMARNPFVSSNNPYSAFIGSLEHMQDFPKDLCRRTTMSSTLNLTSAVEAFRDSFYQTKQIWSDPVVIFTTEMHEMRTMEKKLREEMKKLHLLYQSRTSSTTVPNILLLLQHSRIVHFCHTPLLFLQRWRLKSAATRDHFLFPTIAASTNDKSLTHEKEAWHTDLCYSFFTEYRRYLQTLGFIPLQIDYPHRKTGLWTTDTSFYNSVFYVQKTILGGILLFTAEFCEPFFSTKLFAIECSRLQTINSRPSINRFTLSFLDECDRIKISMHLHSFTYDYHLRSIYNYISNNGCSKVIEKYNVNYFLQDFMRYYTKAPNFARNLVHFGTITITNLLTEGKQLFEYLLSNVNQYDFKVLEMETDDGDPEYILVQVTNTSQIFYKDAQDYRHEDDFDVSLVVYYQCAPFDPSDNILHLKYYLILTSKKEIYPKIEIERKIGKFRTVSSIEKEKPPSHDLTKESEELKKNTSVESIDTSRNVQSSKIHDLYHIEISQESVHYLGYYSSHEELMQKLILEKAAITKEHIKDMVAKGVVDCRTHLLWNQLISGQDSLSYDEFVELKDLTKLEHLCDIYHNLGFLLNQPLTWYQGLTKLLIIKYTDQYRIFTSADGNRQHYVILHPRYFGALMMLSMDLQTSRGDLYVVYRETHQQEDFDLCLAYRKELLNGFVNCICFYLWSGMI